MARWLLGLSVAFILAATLTPGGTRLPDAWLESCLRCGSFWLQDDISNLVLFLPLGAFARLGGWRVGRITVFAAVLSLSIETAQYLLVPGRDSSLSDFLTNTTGALLGALLAPAAGRALFALGAVARRWLRLAAGGVLVFSVAASALMRPSAALTPVWVQVEPALEGAERARLAVTRATIDGAEVDVGRMRNTAGIREKLRRTDLVASVNLSQVELPRDGWALFRMADPLAPAPVEIFSTARGWVGRMAWRAEDFGLRSADVLLPYAAATTAPLTLTLERQGAALSLSERSAAGERTSRTSLNATMAWIPFTPAVTDLSGNFQWLGLAWVLGVAALLGWWASRSGGWGAFAEAAEMVAAAWLLPVAISGMAVPPWWAWVAASGGGTLGAACGITVRQRR